MARLVALFVAAAVAAVPSVGKVATKTHQSRKAAFSSAPIPGPKDAWVACLVGEVEDNAPAGAIIAMMRDKATGIFVVNKVKGPFGSEAMIRPDGYFTLRYTTEILNDGQNPKAAAASATGNVSGNETDMYASTDGDKGLAGSTARIMSMKLKDCIHRHDLRHG